MVEKTKVISFDEFTILPCRPSACQVCGVEHPEDAPHNRGSMYYQYTFYQKHGRWPTWKDASNHCSPESIESLKSVLKRQNIAFGE